MLKRDYVLLAHTYNPKVTIAGWNASVKLDGMRCWYDGGTSRGLYASEVPYANVEKDSRYKEPPICTGLFTRYGNPIQAPSWFLNLLPDFPLDGELWCGNGSFQKTMSIVKDLNPSDEWQDVQYMIFDSPPPKHLLMDGEIRIQNYKKILSGCYEWWRNTHKAEELDFQNWDQTLRYLYRHIQDTHNVKVHEQIPLAFNTSKAIEEMENLLESTIKDGGEGLILRKLSSIWFPKRSYDLLKVKKYKDAEAKIIGYTSGRETDKGSKLLGLMGALVTDYNGKRLELSGFTEDERDFDTIAAREWCEDNPGKDVPDWINHPLFPKGSVVSFKYRELTDGNIPKEARYWRKYENLP